MGKGTGMVELTTHGCGRSWKQRGERTGHCGQCHNTFEGNVLFETHFERTPDGRVKCKDPAEMKFKGEPLVFDGTHGDGAWSAARTFFDPSAVWGQSGTTTASDDSDASEVAS